MANSNLAVGFTPSRNWDGSLWEGGIRPYLIPSSNATATFIGDLLKTTGGVAQVAATQPPSMFSNIYLPKVAQATAATTALLGPAIAFEPLTNALTNVYRLASVAQVAYVCDDPNVILIAGTDGTSGITLAQHTLNADIKVIAGSTVTGVSGMLIDSGTTTNPATTSSLPIKILRPIADGNVNVPASQYNLVECKINAGIYVAGTTAV